MPVKAKPVAPTGRAKPESELKALRLDASYSDRYAANHKQVVARVQQIMTELYPGPTRATASLACAAWTY